MSRQRKRQFRFASFAILPAILVILAALVPAFLSATDDAGALNTTELEKVRGYVESYINSQWTSGAEGEAGFTIDQAGLKARIDSNNNGTYLGDGDDAANAPVLVDNIYSQNNVIPGTSVRCNWNGAAANAASCFNTDRVNAVKNRVNAHEAAGFSTDVVVYCVTGHTEAPATGGFGYIAQAGGLGGTTAPNVYAFKFGRQGWTNNYAQTGSYAENNNIGSVAAPSTTYASPSQAQCGGTSDAELVRCTAAWAIDGAGGNVSNGVNPSGTAPNQALAGRPIDIRSGSPTNTILNGGGNPAAIQIPVEDVFSAAGLQYIDVRTTASPNIFASRTQHLGGIVAMGARMLGYNAAFLANGMPNWNGTMQEKWVSTGVAYSTISATANDLNSGVDQTAPTQSGVGHSNVTQSTADISRTANEPASMKIEYGTTTAYGEVDYNTVLKNGARTEQLTGLTPGTTYYYRVTSYDGQANASASATGSFTTQSLPVEDTTDPVVTYTGPTGTVENSSPTVTGTATDNVGVTSVKLSLNGGAATDCSIDGSGNVSCPTSGLADGDYSAVIAAYDAAGNDGSASGSFAVQAPPLDETAPVVTYTGPTGTVYEPSPTVTGTATDNVGVAAVAMSLNGGAASSCSIDGGGSFSCPTNGLEIGDYTAVITASDAANNVGSAQGSFTVAFAPPELTLQRLEVYWASYADYENRQLSIDMRINNISEGAAVGTQVTHVTATNGVSVSTGLPLALGDISGGGTLDFTLVYTVPEGVTSFNTQVFAKCQDTQDEWHNYPEGIDPPEDPEADMFQAKWDELNGAPGEPASDVYDVRGGKARDYANGCLFYCETHDTVYWVYGAILAKYEAIGGPDSFLGLPDSDPYNYRLGSRSDFHGGYIYSTQYFTIAVPNGQSYLNGWSANWSSSFWWTMFMALLGYAG